jgi:hypothetical protein
LEQAIESGADWNIVDELGDVLFGVLSLAAAIDEAHSVSLEDADEHAAQKMTDRHPYVFGNAVDPGPELASLLWDERKRMEESERIENRTAVIGTGVAVLPASSTGVFTDHLAEKLAQSLASFESGTTPGQAISTTPDGRSATVWTASSGRLLVYSFIGGPATSPEAVSTTIHALSPTEHATHMRGVTSV